MNKFKGLEREQVFDSIESKTPVSIDILHHKIRFLREALGMTQKQLGARIGISQPTYAKMEKGLASANAGTIKRIAGELNCSLEVVLVPAEPFKDLIERQAKERAKELLDRARSTMAMEGQDPGEKEYERRFNELVEELREDPKSGLWGNKR